MTDNRLSLICLVNGEPTSNAISIKIHSNDTVDDLKKLIKANKTNAFSDINADQLTFWRVSIPVALKNERKEISLADISSMEELDETDDISYLFNDKPIKNTIHIIVKRPPQVKIWGEHVKRIEDKLLAPGSVYRDKLVRFVRGDQSFPTTEGPLGGLPFVVARATSAVQSDQPTLLFLDLPLSPEPQYPRSTADDALDRARRPETLLLSLLGVSGCGKMRTAIEMLCKNWGFYFPVPFTDKDKFKGPDGDLSFMLQAQMSKLSHAFTTHIDRITYAFQGMAGAPAQYFAMLYNGQCQETDRKDV
ncbi:hypothetical protein BGZ47_002815, partial [Haplosporangium gracile]